MQLAFINIPIVLSKSYKTTKKNFKDISQVIIFNDYEANVNIYKHWFNKCSIQFNIVNNDHATVNAIYEKLKSVYGEATFITLNNNKVWKVDNYYIIHGITCNRFDILFHTLTITFIKPMTLFNYKKYLVYETVIRNRLLKYNIDKVQVTVSLDGFMSMFNTEDFSYLIIINHNHIHIFSSEVIINGTMQKIMPFKNSKSKFQSSKELDGCINDFLNMMQKFDSSLLIQKLNGSISFDI